MPEVLHDTKHSVEKDLLWRVPGPNSQHDESLGRSVSDAAASWASNNAHVGQETPCNVRIYSSETSSSIAKADPWLVHELPHLYLCWVFTRSTHPGSKCAIYPVSVWKRNKETLHGYHRGWHKSLNILWSEVLHKEKILHCETIALRFLCRCLSKSEQSNPSKQMPYPIS
jgi:hypothetical protein